MASVESAGDKSIEVLLEEQVAYYRARASEYDDWFLRRGRYDRGVVRNLRWFEQVEQVRARLASAQAELPENARVLELACGTGLWTERLVARGARVTAVDTSPEVIELNRARLREAKHGEQVDYQQADLFAWRPVASYDFVFLGFWLSHVPLERFEFFWRFIAEALEREGRVFFVDNLHHQERTPMGHHLDSLEATRVTRTLLDGRVFEIVKIFYEPSVLEERLRSLGWSIEVRKTENYFLHGAGGFA